MTALAADRWPQSIDATMFGAGHHHGLQGRHEVHDVQGCVALINKGVDIDYEGVSGPCDLGATGSPTKATIGIFQYGETTRSTNLKYVTGVIPG